MSTIHRSWVLLGCRSALRCGTARFSTVRSMAYSRQGRAITASPIHSRRPALGCSTAVSMVATLLMTRVQLASPFVSPRRAEGAGRELNGGADRAGVLGLGEDDDVEVGPRDVRRL